MSSSDSAQARPAGAALLLDTPPEEAFDRFTRLVAQVLHVPVALVSILDTNRQFFKSAFGLDGDLAAKRETPLSHSFCQYVVRDGQALIVDDARRHPLVKDNVAVSEYGVVGYAGFPICGKGGRALGALCAIDKQPHAWTKRELEILETLAKQVSNEIEAREQLTQMGIDAATMKEMEMAPSAMNRAGRQDLHTPLNAMYLSMQAVQAFGPLNKEQHECLAMAKANMRTMLEMVDQLVELGQRGSQALHLAPCDARAIVAQATHQVGTLADAKRIMLASSVALPGQILADQEKLVRVLVQLIANGIQFTPNGGQVSISATPSADGLPMLQFAVRDNGIGMEPKEVCELFKEGAGAEAAAANNSTALGLVFCQRVIEAHGGKIWVESGLGKGSVFHFTIPSEGTNA